MRTNTAILMLIFIALGTVAHGAKTSVKVMTQTPAAVSEGSEEVRVVLSFDIYRIGGDISGETSLTDFVWPNSDAQADSIKKGFRFFTIADLKIAGIEFKAGQDGWTWNGERVPTGTERVSLLSTPKVMARAGQRFELQVGPTEAVAYFEKRPDGLFELKAIDTELGLIVMATAKEGGEDRILLEDFRIELRSIEGREPIDGVPLDVGAPRIEVERYTATLSLRAGRDYGVQIRTGKRFGGGFLLVRMRADLAGAEG